MWKHGKFKINGIIYQWCAKVYDEPSEFGINNGRVSKLEIRRGDTTVLNYDRGWDIKPDNDADVENIYRCIMCMFSTEFHNTIITLIQQMRDISNNCDTIADTCEDTYTKPSTEDTLNNMMTLCESITNTIEEAQPVIIRHISQNFVLKYSYVLHHTWILRGDFY